MSESSMSPRQTGPRQRGSAGHSSRKGWILLPLYNVQEALRCLFGAAVRFPGVALKFTKSQPKYYRSSACAKRGFCSDCGSPVAFFFEGDPDAWISVGS